MGGAGGQCTRSPAHARGRLLLVVERCFVNTLDGTQPLRQPRMGLAPGCPDHLPAQGVGVSWLGKSQATSRRETGSATVRVNSQVSQHCPRHSCSLRQRLLLGIRGRLTKPPHSTQWPNRSKQWRLRALFSCWLANSVYLPRCNDRRNHKHFLRLINHFGPNRLAKRLRLGIEIYIPVNSLK